MVMPSQDDIHPVLLRILLENSGGIETVAVYPLVTRAFPELTSDDRERLTKDGRNLWENRIRFARKDLVDAGLLDNSQYGVWKLTQAGMAEAEALIEAGAPDQSLATVRSMLITLLYQIDNDELPWSAERRDDGSIAIFYDGRLRVVVMA